MQENTTTMTATVCAGYSNYYNSIVVKWKIGNEQNEVLKGVVGGRAQPCNCLFLQI